MLSKKCQYALHALKYIANQPSDSLVTIKEIAEGENIPKKFLEAILADLKLGGILASKQGKFGGYYLNRDPKKISILEVIRKIDGAVAMLPCVSLNFYSSCGRCDNEETCKIKEIFSKVRDETLKVLSKTTVKDLIAQPDIIKMKIVG
jgi:Rrf2 family protein